MPEQKLAGGELWLHPDETVAKVVDLGTPELIGLITTREGGLHYASILALSDQVGYRFGVPRWEFGGIERSICNSLAEAEDLIRNFLSRGR